MFANSREPDQAPRSAASDLILHCLLVSHKKDARLKWVKQPGICIEGQMIRQDRRALVKQHHFHLQFGIIAFRKNTSVI